MHGRLRGEGSHELELLLRGLETSVAELGGGVDELDVDFLEVLPGGMVHHTLPQGDGTLLGSDDAALEHEPVVGDDTVLDKSSHGCDGLLGKVSSGRARFVVSGLSDTVDLLVELATVEVSVLSGAGDSGGHTSRVPGSNTGDLPETTVGLPGKAGDSPPGGDALVSLSLGDADDVDVLVLGKDRVDGDLLLEERLGEVDLGSSISSVDLDLADVGLLDPEVELLDLGVGNDADDGAELLDPVELVLDVVALVLLGVLGEGLLLALEPVLVEPAPALVGEVLGEDTGEGPEPTGGLDVSDDTDNDHGGGLDNGDGINNLLLVHESTGAVDSTDDVGHAGLVAHEGSQVARLGGVVLGEGANAATVVAGPLLGEETKVSAAGSFELTVRHTCFVELRVGKERRERGGGQWVSWVR